MDLKGAILRNFYTVGTLVTEPTPEKFFSLKIPHYQRPYKWDADRVSRLIEDWHDNRSTTKESENKEYFAGAVVTVAEGDSGIHSLIDGQQRITTLFLANFINFSLLRNLILSEIERKRCGKILSYSDALNRSVHFIFRDSTILAHFKAATEHIKLLSDDDKMDELHETDDHFNQMREYYNLLWIPQYTIEEYPTEECYKKAVSDMLSQKITPDSLNLHYDRASFNDSLAKVLSSLYLIFSGNTMTLKEEIIDEIYLSDNEKVYATSMKAIITTLKSIVSQEGVFYTYMHNLHQTLTQLLDEVKVCVIQTGATDDAYTLFEVMNDRALELDDLDLIKNQFFKKFVLSNQALKEQAEAHPAQKISCLTEQEVDQKIQALDKQWGDVIFNHPKMGVQYKKLVTYFSTVFLTGNEDATNNKNEKYRTFLEAYLSKQAHYTFEDIQRDFNVFQICFDLLINLSLPLQKRENESLLVEYMPDASDFKKAIYFLNAQKQDGVISGLINFYLKSMNMVVAQLNPEYIRPISQLMLKTGVTIDDIKRYYPQASTEHLNYLKKLMDDVQIQAKALWTTSMMAANASLPRELARQIIAEHHLHSAHGKTLRIHESSQQKQLDESFNDWLHHWNYDKDSSFKIKTLFAKLLRFNYVDDQLTQTPVIMTINSSAIKGMELDHLVARKSGDSSVFVFEHDERDAFINGLGNMMPLPKKENIKKSDCPLEQSFKFYEASGLTKHFLIDELQILVSAVQNKEMTPLEFFTRRKELLIRYFKQIVHA
ncbi:DUF262 domain-containing protein [Wohlfahrtiimonas chitiniclastica]|uniref:DUF262 domain-containing protein n=1 Tax=Wohlfahrtiimonas chitiniclastica TaxID=400946 RepID=UPI001BCC3C01|nr:DUF262 domain-containing protein [Wohlfahrtiimonas chitiniclastica]MBS7814167.1 DUF262 domain-containing protein [Wohlfahrtiimonas chitiniclastica]